ncbi:hypothetical protein ISG33_07370 [Glaciecola sp. MH2013]|uniref:hypothetical protein n=1 Tax=Glaciecola sp. MH2013 TaxID=2785524 RepID=UPI00189D1B02|nr:hypothetical protein [Glaciecola sp. MH2013]MBF7073214.1 hypothetical protein [Glaciecola sp. MH2013]
MSLYKLLLSVEQKGEVNFDRLIKFLPKDHAWSDIFKVSAQISQGRHAVEIIDYARFAKLRNDAMPTDIRSEAARRENMSSHDVACNSAYMLCYPVTSEFELTIKNNKTPTGIAHPPYERALLNVASVAGVPQKPLFTPASSAILIENQDCFFRWSELVQHFTLPIRECDIYFAGGKRILNPSFAPFLSRYDELFCLFDYDYEGLKIAKDLITKDYARTYYVSPTLLSEKRHLFTFEPKSTSSLLAAVSLCEALEQGELLDTMRKARAFMEQEALLDGLKPS